MSEQANLFVYKIAGKEKNYQMFNQSVLITQNKQSKKENQELKDFFSNGMPSEIRKFDISVISSLKGEIKGIVSNVLPRVSEELLISKSELDGNDLKTYFQLASKVKRIEFSDCNIRKIDDNFEIMENEYSLQELSFKSCHFSSSNKRAMTLLNNLLLAMSKRNYIYTLKSIELKLNSALDLDIQKMTEQFNKMGYTSLVVKLS